MMPGIPPDVPVWTIRPGTMTRGWAARIEGRLSALDLEVVPAITLWDAYRATCDGVPLPFGTWMMQDGPTQTVADVQELRDDCDALGEEVQNLRNENEALKAENVRLAALASDRDDFLHEIGEIVKHYEDRLYSALKQEAEQ